MMTSPSVEHMDDIDYKQETESFEHTVMETEKVVTADYGPDWSEDWALGDGIWFGMRWIGTTMRDEWHRSWMGTSLVTVKKPINEEPDQMNASKHEDWQVCPAAVEDWPLDFEEVQLWNGPEGVERWWTARDWNPDYLMEENYGWDFNLTDEEALEVVNGGFTMEMPLVLMPMVNYVQVFIEDIAMTEMMESIEYQKVGLCLSLLVLLGAVLWTILRSRVAQCRCRKRQEVGRLSLRKKRWNGKLNERFEFRLRLKGLLLLGCWTTAQSMDAGQAAQIMNQMMQLTEAATTAARASASALEKMEQRKEGGNFGEASKVLRAPDSLDGDDPLKYVAWRETFVNWLSYGDSRFAELLRDVEALDEPCQLSDFATPQVRQLATRLYSILASYIKGPALQLVRAESNEKNGFRVWQQLRDLYMPRARPRVMAIGQAIMSHPSFARDRSMLESLLQMDLLLDQYRVASGHPMPDDLVVATVLRCIEPSLRRHLELTMDDSITYEGLKEKLILMDKNSRVWSGDSYLKLVQNSLKNDPGGPAPMEVDNVNMVGGKGKFKGGKKGKGKQKGWFPYGFGGKASGKSQKSKGKTKGKGKKGKKGKGKPFGGKGKGGHDRNTCRICGQQGHWGNECPNKANIVTTATNSNMYVESEIASSAGGKVQGSGSSVASTTATKPQIRQVRMYHLETPRAEQSPVLFDLRSEDGGDWWYEDDCNQINTVTFVIHEEDSEVEEEDVMQSDNVYRWFQDIALRRYSLPAREEEKVEFFSVCTVQETERKMLIVLDSGADISLLPKSMSSCGRASGGGKAVLEDAQKGRLRIFGKKIAQIECEGSRETVIIEDDFVVASVQTPLISLGRLLQRGWRMIPGDGEAGVHLQAPDHECQILLRFKKNSLALFGSIRRIVHEPDEIEGGPGDGQHHDDDEVLVIQTVLQLHSKFWQNYGLRAWKTTPEGNPVRFSYDSKNFVNGQLIWNLNWWPLRSTLIKKDDDTWEIVEHCNQYYTTEEPDGEIPECQGIETQVLTVLHRKKEPLAFFGTVVGEQTVTAGGVDVDSQDFSLLVSQWCHKSSILSTFSNLRRLIKQMLAVLGMAPCPCLRTKRCCKLMDSS